MFTLEYSILVIGLIFKMIWLLLSCLQAFSICFPCKSRRKMYSWLYNRLKLLKNVLQWMGKYIVFYNKINSAMQVKRPFPLNQQLLFLSLNSIITHQPVIQNIMAYSIGGTLTCTLFITVFKRQWSADCGCAGKVYKRHKLFRRKAGWWTAGGYLTARWGSRETTKSKTMALRTVKL